MTPHKSYRIWFSNRNGSTLLCQGLIDTEIAGNPGEHFNKHHHPSLGKLYNVNSYETLKEKLWSIGSSSNGVFGIKHAVTTDHFNSLCREICKLRSIPYSDELNQEVIWSDLFPNCKHIFLTRRNKIRQAVSWWKAIKDHKWHLKKEEVHENSKAFYEQHYDYDALLHLFKEAVLRECAIQEYFTRYNIQSLTIVYEDFVANYEATIRAVVDYLEIPYKRLNVPPKYSRPTASERSEVWVQRFRRELQAPFKSKAW